MSTLDTSTKPLEPVRGNLLLTGEDATLWVALCAYLLHRDNKLPTITQILRDAIRCYAKHLGVINEA